MHDKQLDARGQLVIQLIHQLADVVRNLHGIRARLTQNLDGDDVFAGCTLAK